jgi:hypothetical protein
MFMVAGGFHFELDGGSQIKNVMVWFGIPASVTVLSDHSSRTLST